MEYPLLKQLRDELDSILKNKDAEQQELPEKGKCKVCGKELENPSHTLCYDHWKKEQEENQDGM